MFPAWGNMEIDDDDLCSELVFYSNQGAGQQCCYNQQGNLLGSLNGGGSLDRFHIEAGVPVFSHFFNDLVPYLDCCLLAKTPKVTCEKYFEKRPSDNGSGYVPPRPGKKIASNDINVSFG